jgi:glycosyltransferase involved in cell wall biosynthesis
MPRVRAVQIGNVANNAYLNAKLLSARGWDCVVVSNDYAHVMGCPEWEDARFVTTSLDEFVPDWGSVDLGGFARPDWFVDGPFDVASAALRRRHGLPARPTATFLARVQRRVVGRLPMLSRFLQERHPMYRGFPVTERNRVASLIIAGSGMREALLRSGLVVGYGTSGWIPRAAGVPFVAFEHGTIRHLPFTDSFEGRMCRDTYLAAAHVMITNCDNDEAARRLGLRSWSFVPHPVNEVDPEPQKVAALRSRLCEQLGCDFLVVHPPRQHWEPSIRHADWEKGNDIFLRGFADFVGRTGARAGCVLIEWGRSLDASRGLLRELGIAGRVAWLPIQPGLQLSELMAACDVVADQFWLGAFGSLTPKAMRLSRPVLLYLNEDRHHWCFPELPPVLNCRTPAQVADHLSLCWRDRSWMRQRGEQSARWYRRFHSNDVIADRFSQVERLIRDRRERSSS